MVNLIVSKFKFMVYSNYTACFLSTTAEVVGSVMNLIND